MLLRIDSQSRLATRVAGQRLKDFGFDERRLQATLFRSLDRLLPDEELLHFFSKSPASLSKTIHTRTLPLDSIC